eukprot:4623092-Prymnesium_polylepis.2
MCRYVTGNGRDVGQRLLEHTHTRVDSGVNTLREWHTEDATMRWIFLARKFNIRYGTQTDSAVGAPCRAQSP